MPLWATDVALAAAGSNISGIFLHTREFDVTYNLFDPPSPNDPTKSGWNTGPIYYTNLVIAETLSATGSVVVDLNIDSPHAVAYGVYDNGGETRGKLVFINYASQETLPPSFAERDASYTYYIPPNVADTIGVRYLLAANLYSGSKSWSTTDQTITWANQTVGPAGDLNGKQHTEFVHCTEGCNVTVPGPGLALVYLLSDTSDKFFHGNSTVALPFDDGDDDSGALGSPGVLGGSSWVWATSVIFSVIIGWLW